MSEIIEIETENFPYSSKGTKGMHNIRKYLEVYQGINRYFQNIYARYKATKLKLFFVKSHSSNNDNVFFENRKLEDHS